MEFLDKIAGHIVKRQHRAGQDQWRSPRFTKRRENEQMTKTGERKHGREHMERQMDEREMERCGDGLEGENNPPHFLWNKGGGARAHNRGPTLPWQPELGLFPVNTRNPKPKHEAGLMG